MREVGSQAKGQELEADDWPPEVELDLGDGRVIVTRQCCHQRRLETWDVLGYPLGARRLARILAERPVCDVCLRQRDLGRLLDWEEPRLTYYKLAAIVAGIVVPLTAITAVMTPWRAASAFWASSILAAIAAMTWFAMAWHNPSSGRGRRVACHLMLVPAAALVSVPFASLGVIFSGWQSVCVVAIVVAVFVAIGPWLYLGALSARE